MKRELITDGTVPVTIRHCPILGGNVIGFPNLALKGGEFSSLAEINEGLPYLQEKGHISPEQVRETLAIAPNIPNIAAIGGLSGEQLRKGLNLADDYQRHANLLARGYEHLLKIRPPRPFCKLLRSEDGYELGLVGFQFRRYLLWTKFNIATFVYELISGKWDFYKHSRMTTIYEDTIIPFNPRASCADAEIITDAVFRLNLPTINYPEDSSKTPMRFFSDDRGLTMVVINHRKEEKVTLCFDKEMASEVWKESNAEAPVSTKTFNRWLGRIQSSTMRPESKIDLVPMGPFYAELFWWGELLCHVNMCTNFSDPTLFDLPEMNP